VVRGATFDCGLLVVVVVDVVDVLLAALLLLEGEPHPTKPMPRAVMAIATPLIAAIRVIQKFLSIRLHGWTKLSANTARTAHARNFRRRRPMYAFVLMF
jgi:hypothetical protein